MSFSSFSTSIVYNDKTVPSTREAAKTAGPCPDHRVNAYDSCLPDQSTFQHAIHEFTKRAPRPSENENKTAVPDEPVKPVVPEKPPEKPGNDTQPTPAVNATIVPVVKEWKHEKASIAASSIFSVVALAALILLSVMLVKKFRRRQRRKRQGDDDSIDEKRRQRESMMFSKNYLGQSYVVEEQKDGQVVRVVCTGPNKARTSTPRTSFVGGPLEKIKSAFSMRAEAHQHLEDLDESSKGRRGSIPKQPVVVSSPLWPVFSHSAIPASRIETRESLKPSDIYDLPIELPYTPSRRSSLLSTSTPQVAENTEADIAPVPSVHSYRRSLLRLPSIRQSISPLVRF